MSSASERRLRARRTLIRMLVTDRRRAVPSLDAVVAGALRGGVTAVMLREKDLPASDLLTLAARLLPLCRGADASLVVNHDVPVGVECGADGVHLGFRSVGVTQARQMGGSARLVGRSTHDLDELDSAREAGADYVTFGPVYDTPSKRGLLEPRGIRGLADAVRRAGDLPVLALGGITPARVAAVRATGCSGIAFIGAVIGSTDPEAAARELGAAWDAAA